MQYTYTHKNYKASLKPVTNENIAQYSKLVSFTNLSINLRRLFSIIT